MIDNLLHVTSNNCSIPLVRDLSLDPILDLTLDTSGKIIGARAASLTWFEKIDVNNISTLSSSGADGRPTTLASQEVKIFISCNHIIPQLLKLLLIYYLLQFEQMLYNTFEAFQKNFPDMTA